MTRDRPSVRETTIELRMVVLALVVLALGAAAVCSLERSTVVRIRKANQPAPLEATGRSLSTERLKIGPNHELLAVAQLHHGPPRIGPYCASADDANSEPARSRFLRFRRPSWER